MRCEATGGLVGGSTGILTVLLILGSSIIDAGVNLEPATRVGSKKELAWQPLVAGLDRVRATYRPALLWYEGTRKSDDVEGDLVELLSYSTLRSTVGRCVLIRIGDEDLTRIYPAPPSGPRILAKGSRKPRKAAGRAGVKGKEKKAAAVRDPALEPRREAKTATVGDRLRLPAGQPALLVLDFRERIVERYDAGVPRRSRLSPRLKKILKINTYLSRRARPVEKALVESRKAFEVGNSRAAILKVRDLESPKIRKSLDPVLQGWSAEVIKEYRDRAGKLLAEAESLEKDGDRLKADSALKYNKALNAYQRIARDFPFKDVARKANQRQGEILRKLSLTGNPFGK